MIYILSFLIYLLVFLFDFLPILKAKQTKTILLYALFFLISFVVIFLKEMEIRLPSPAAPIKYFISNVLHLQ